jgi:hypothetical protein
MRYAMRVGAVAGIPVHVHWSVLVILLLLAQGVALSVLPANAAGQSRALDRAVAVIVAVIFWPRCWRTSWRTHWSRGTTTCGYDG